MVLADARRVALDLGDGLDQTRPIQLGAGVLGSGAEADPTPAPDPPSLHEGALLSGRYRVLQRIAGGWLAYDERLSRPVFVAAILGQGECAAERVRREAARGVPLVDAIIDGDAAFAVRAMSHIA